MGAHLQQTRIHEWTQRPRVHKRKTATARDAFVDLRAEPISVRYRICILDNVRHAPTDVEPGVFTAVKVSQEGRTELG
jgi:hypothetical protein